MAGLGRIVEFRPRDRDSGGESRTMGLDSHNPGTLAGVIWDRELLSTLSFSFLIYSVTVTPDEGESASE